jgi:hypothetical protein
VGEQPPRKIDYATPAPGRPRAEWRVPWLFVVLVLLLGAVIFLPALMSPVFPVPSDPPLTRPSPAVPATGKAE